MELTTNKAFLKWAESRGIGMSPKYPALLAFVPYNGDSRWWRIPLDRSDRLAMMTISLDAMDAWESCWVVKRQGNWAFGREDRPDPHEYALDTINRWTGIPNGYNGAVRFDKQDRAKLVLTLMVFDEYGFNLNFDLFIVPDHGKQILWFDHEEAIIVRFSDPGQIDPYITRMSAAGFPECHDSSCPVI